MPLYEQTARRRRFGRFVADSLCREGKPDRGEGEGLCLITCKQPSAEGRGRQPPAGEEEAACRILWSVYYEGCTGRDKASYN